VTKQREGRQGRRRLSSALSSASSVAPSEMREFQNGGREIRK